MIKDTDKLRKGDYIMALVDRDGNRYDLSNDPIEITKFVGLIDNGPNVRKTVHVHVRQRKSAIISPDRYFMLGQWPQVDVARKTHMAGRAWWKMDDETYVEVGGSWRIEATQMASYCEDEHPVKITPKVRAEIRSEPQFFPSSAKDALANRKRGYLCPGGMEHVHVEWIAHDDSDPNFDHQGLYEMGPTEVARNITKIYTKGS